MSTKVTKTTAQGKVVYQSLIAWAEGEAKACIAEQMPYGMYIDYMAQWTDKVYVSELEYTLWTNEVANQATNQSPLLH